ncbi:EamA family transporter [Paenibacillus sp. GCM10012307]|uniref:DMT family transporter n=1 Tax=Paenibacillus roseus TaxID=2798579 RepID=A0A934J2R9_9BACL|nr:DMT family transporter [Paenibacillus roseus]MBJ6362219.1 DMT family transporter [Paenibacillus roseus]
MWLFIAIGSAVLFGLAGLGMKVSQMKQGSVHMLLLGLYITGTLGFAAHSIYLDTDWNVMLDWKYWVAGAVIGAGSAWGNAIFMKALDYGPAALTSPLTNVNIVLVVLMSTLFYKETLAITEGLAIALLLFSVVIISARRQEPLSAPEKKWFVYIAAAIILFAFRNGGLKVTEELAMANSAVLFIAYLLSIIWFFPPALKEWSEQRTLTSAQSQLEGARKLRTGVVWGLLSGLFSYGGLQLYAVALETGKANLAAPIFATNSLVVAFGAILLFRERLTPLQVFSLVCTMGGLVMIRL